MQCIKPDPMLKFNPDTFITLRRQYNYDKPGEMDSAIDVLENWIKKQEHFTKKEYSRDYLERSIILVKGSVERAKRQIDKICTMRTLLPKYFEFNFAEFEEYKDKFALVLLPKLTDDNYRILLAKFFCPSNELNSTLYFVYFKFGVMLWEYLKNHDYCDGIIFVADYSGQNILQAVSALNMVELHQLVSIGLQGFQLRVKNVLILSESNSVNVLVAVMKQLFPKKIADRISVHKTAETLQEVIPKEILPSDFGGHESSVAKIRDDWLQLCKKEENVKYFNEITKARTNEALRQSGKFNEQHLGTPGSFRSLNVD
ncbi:hypothetical protein K1T71_011320 [Dendrolimus kikuchii]|uniref:Uncharacterized protein n=1 Tax=Dendrolimus kikuchii TaxID=765133 RepID=A0ACC1CNH6_9NEOP|nr:hypothetical protein K1T71_011320 [Dendrolimus kikuchii]